VKGILKKKALEESRIEEFSKPPVLPLDSMIARVLAYVPTGLLAMGLIASFIKGLFYPLLALNISIYIFKFIDPFGNYPHYMLGNIFLIGVSALILSYLQHRAYNV